MCDQPEFASKKLQRSETSCYNCGKIGHTKYTCKHREQLRGIGRTEINPSSLGYRHLRNIIISGIPNKDGAKVKDVVQKLMSIANISEQEYELSHALPQQDLNGLNEYRITFLDRVAKYNFLYRYNRNYVCEWNIKRGHPLKFGTKTFFIKCRPEKFPIAEEIIAKSLELKRNFDGLTLKPSSGKEITATYEACSWQLRSLKDVNDLRMTLVKFRNKSLKENFTNKLKQRPFYSPVF